MGKLRKGEETGTSNGSGMEWLTDSKTVEKGR